MGWRMKPTIYPVGRDSDSCFKGVPGLLSQSCHQNSKPQPMGSQVQVGAVDTWRTTIFPPPSVCCLSGVRLCHLHLSEERWGVMAVSLGFLIGLMYKIWLHSWRTQNRSRRWMKSLPFLATSWFLYSLVAKCSRNQWGWPFRSQWRNTSWGHGTCPVELQLRWALSLGLHFESWHVWWDSIPLPSESPPAD